MSVNLLFLPLKVLFPIFFLLCKSQHASGLISPTQSSRKAFVNPSLALNKSSIVAISTSPLTHRNYDRFHYKLSKTSTTASLETTKLFASTSGTAEEGNVGEAGFDPVLSKISRRLRRANWISWWCQVILTVISSIILLFARSVMNAVVGPPGTVATSAPGGFLFAGSGIVLSYLSIIWTWGGTRLSRRLRRNSTKTYSRIKAATMIRRAIVIGTTINLSGMLVTLIGAEQIVGLLAAKVLTMQGLSPFQASFGAGLGGAGLGAQSVQPLDVLIVQANTNTLLSHFLSLVCCLILTRSVYLLDPPSVEDDER